MKKPSKFILCCANGAGSSLIMQLTIQKVLDKVALTPAKIHRCSVSEGKVQALQYDVVFTTRNFVELFEEATKKGVIVIALQNIMSPDEIESSMREHGIIN